MTNGKTEIVKVEPIVDVFDISWNLSPRCNYNCSYCPPYLHDSVTPHLSLSALQKQWETIFDKTKHLKLKYSISISGGEVTGNKNFIPFMQWLRDKYGQHIFKIVISSNGSATKKYYENLFKLVDNISFSIHSEHIDEKKFFQMVTTLNISKDKHMHVVIMDEHWNQDRIKMYKEILTKYNIPWGVHSINYSAGTRNYQIFKGKLNLEKSNLL